MTEAQKMAKEFQEKSRKNNAVHHPCRDCDQGCMANPDCSRWQGYMLFLKKGRIPARIGVGSLDPGKQEEKGMRIANPMPNH